MTISKSPWDEHDWGVPSIPHSVRKHRRNVRIAWFVAAAVIMLVGGYLGAPSVGWAVVAVRGAE